MPRKRRQNLQLDEEKKMEENIFEPVFEPIFESEEPKAEPQPIYKVRVTHPSLRKRSAPSTQAEINGLIQDHGVYEIFEETNGWGKLADNNWIMLTYTEQLF